MFFKDFIPEKQEDFIINKNIVDRIAREKGLMNSIIYGSNGVGKFTLARMMVRKHINWKKLNIKNSSFLDNKINSSNYHFEIFVNQYNYKDKTSFIETLDQFTDNVNISTGENNIIIIKNADLLSRDNILSIKKYSERRDKCVTFILTMKSISKYSNTLNNFFMYRVPTPSLDEITQFICNKVEEMELIGVSEQEIRKIVKNNNNNLKGIFIDSEIIYLGNQIYNEKKIKVKNEINKFTKKIINSIFNYNYEEVRDNIYELSTKNVEKSEIINLIFNKLMKCEIDDDLKMKITGLASKYSARLAKCNKEIIQIEAFSFECMSLFITE